jgi:hypothetical protein
MASKSHAIVMVTDTEKLNASRNRRLNYRFGLISTAK